MEDSPNLNLVNTRHSIILGYCGEVVWLRVEGAGSRENSADVATHVQPELQRGKRSFVVDLEMCTSLDSTFMGMLIGLSKQITQAVQGCLHVINAQGRNAQLLRGLGVQYFCQITEDDGPFAKRSLDEACECGDGTTPLAQPTATRDDVVYCGTLAHQDLTKRELTEHCLKAHTTLCEAGKENQEKFQHVVELMEQKLVQLNQ
jgi:anti-sigma B factor antagonist